MGLSLIWPDDHSKELVVLTVDDFDIVNLMQLTQKNDERQNAHGSIQSNFVRMEDQRSPLMGAGIFLRNGYTDICGWES